MSERLLFEQAREELLGKVLGVLRTAAASADVGVKRIPIGAAQAADGFLGAAALGGASGQDDGPMGGGKQGPAVLARAGLVARVFRAAIHASIV
jgi:hypothetical protein